MLAGLPKPVVQCPVRVADGLILHPDLAYEEWKVAVEYDGIWHADPRPATPRPPPPEPTRRRRLDGSARHRPSRTQRLPRCGPRGEGSADRQGLAPLTSTPTQETYVRPKIWRAPSPSHPPRYQGTRASPRENNDVGLSTAPESPTSRTSRALTQHQGNREPPPTRCTVSGAPGLPALGPAAALRRDVPVA